MILFRKQLQSSFLACGSLLLLLFPTILYSQVQKSDSTSIQLFMLSLTKEYNYRTLPSYRGNVDQSDILVLDSVKICDHLPRLQNARFIPVSTATLDSMARVHGDTRFVQLMSLHISANTAKLHWRHSTAHFFKRYQIVRYLSDMDSEHEYHLTAKGWVGGSTRTIVNEHLSE
jgi:hypothetical protein